MTTSGSYEDLFKKELGKYDQICQEIQKNVDAQGRLLQQIKVRIFKISHANQGTQKIIPGPMLLLGACENVGAVN